MLVQAHARAKGFAYTDGELWFIPLVVEYDNGTTGVEDVPYLEHSDIQAVEKYFKSPTLEPLVVDV